jgi:hypothetical protein
MPNTQDAEATSSSGPPVDVTDDIHGRSDDVVSLDGRIESSISLNSVNASGSAGMNIELGNVPYAHQEVPMVARNSKFFIEDELCRFKVGATAYPMPQYAHITSSRSPINTFKSTPTSLLLNLRKQEI